MNEILVAKSKDGIKLALPNDIRTSHVQIIGSTGRGKTESVIIPWMMQDMLQERRSILIDGKGDKSIYDLLQQVNHEEGNAKEIAYFDIANLRESWTTNPLKYGTSQQIVDRIFSSLEFENSYFKIISERACLLVVKMIHSQKEEEQREVSFKRIFEALSDDGILAKEFSGVQEIEQKNFEGEISKFLNLKYSDRQEKFSGFLAQISPLAVGELSSVLNGATKNKKDFYLSEILCPKIVDTFVNEKENFKTAMILLPTLLYQQSAAILGKIFLQEIAWGIAQRESMNFKEFTSLFLDEFSSFVYPGFLGILNKARSTKTAIHISHQSMGDLSSVSDSFAQGVHTNTNVKCVLGVNDPETADFFAKHFGTLETVEATERAEKNLFGEFERSGSLNVRQSEAYKIHPNNLKNYSQGKGVLSFIHQSHAITEEVQFLRSPYRLQG